MRKHSDWSALADILGRAGYDLKSEITDIARGKSADVREGLAQAVDGIADKIRYAGAPAPLKRELDRNQHSLGRLPLVLGIGGALIGMALLTSERSQSNS